MFEIFSYSFFRNALLAVVLLSVCSALIGTYIITRRMVAISGGVTHACFGGLGLGYFLGVNPLLAAGVFAVGSSAFVEWMSRKLNIREDSAIAVIWALGMAVGVLFIFMTPGYVPELNSFLFGNVLTVSHADLWAFAVFTLVLILFFALKFRQIVVCAFDRDFAFVCGLPVTFISYAMTALVAICIVLTIRLAGIMMLMSMLSLPMMAAENLTSRFFPILCISAILSVVCAVGGLITSAFIDIPASAFIVFYMAGMYILTKIYSALRGK